MNRSDALGQSYNLTGFLAFVSVNNNQAAAGNALILDAPALTTPDALLTAVITLTSASLSIAYTATPLPTGARLFSYAGPQRSAGRNFENDLRLIAVSAAAAASPANLFTPYSTKWGTPVATNRIFFAFRVYLGGFLSGALTTSQIVS
jgi:hypothetical protein